ncbi:MAG: hypothetical protein ABL877_03200 [Thiobacillus sp.]
MSKKTLIAAAVGTAFAATLAAPLASAAENPFALSGLDKGYMVAEHNDGHSKMMKEGKCGEGKCGAAKKKDGDCGHKAKDGKCGAEGKCGHSKTKDGKCGEGKCGGDKTKMKDGKCGEGKCGGTKK